MDFSGLDGDFRMLRFHKKESLPILTGSCSKEKQCWSSANFCAPAVMLSCIWLGLGTSFLALEVTGWKVLNFRISYCLSFSVHSSGHEAAEVLAKPEFLSSCSPVLGQACLGLHRELHISRAFICVESSEMLQIHV